MASLQEALSKVNDPEIRHVVSVSGGKDSAALAVFLTKNYPQIPAEYVFCDTGCELPETYDYLELLEAELGKKIIKLNALEMLGIRVKPNRTAFDTILNEYYGGFLPNPKARWCTRLLKIRPFEKFIGNDTAYSYIGIRGDEDRDGYIAKKPPKISDQPNIIPVYPFRDEKLGISDIKVLLEQSGLGLPEYYKWRSRSGCYFCFYQQIGEWQGLKENHPDLFEKSKKYEKIENGKFYTWTQGRSLKELEELRERYKVQGADEADGCAICHL